MAATITHTLKAVGGDYTLISAWEADQARDLVTLDQIEVLECYNDWPSGLSDNVNIANAAWVVDATRYIKVTVPITERHNGTPNSGFLVVEVAGTVFQVNKNHTIIEYVATKATSAGSRGFTNGAGGSNGERFIGCLVQEANSQGFLDLSNAAGGAVGYINCIAMNCTSSGFLKAGGTTGTLFAYNCSSIDNLVGFQGSNTGVDLSTFKNCLANGNSSGDFVFPLASASIAINCASGDATADDATGTGTTGNRISQTFTFADALNDNFKLNSTDAGAKDFGVDLSADGTFAFDYDVLGAIRPQGTNWDIGFHEAVVLHGNRGINTGLQLGI